MVPLEVEAEDIGTQDFDCNDEQDNDSHRKEGNGNQRCTGCDGIVDGTAPCVLIRGEDGPFIVVDESFFVKVLGHNGPHVGRGEAQTSHP